MKTNIRRLGFDIDFLAQEEIKRLPRKLFKSKTTTFCDLSIGGGQFLRAIVAELKGCGHSDENIKGRIYGFESNRFYLNAGSFDLLGNFYVDKDQSFDVIKHMKFDVIVGNSPYQKQVGPNKTEAIWDKFVFKSLEYLKKDGYLALIHPSGWRNVSGRFLEVKNILLSKQIEYLEIHNEKDGLRTFGAETRYDWYILKNVDRTKNYKTNVRFEDGSKQPLDLTEMSFIPNHSYDKLVKLIAKPGEQKVEMINNSAYHTQRSYIKNEKINEFKYPVVYTVNSENKPIFYYSNTNKNGHFGIPKVIWSNGRISSIGSYIDFKGKVGLTQFAYAIVDAPENLPSIKKAFDCIELRNLMEASAVGLLTVNQKVLSLFRKDFWKDFL
jgi:hypothetical protein